MKGRAGKGAAKEQAEALGKKIAEFADPAQVRASAPLSLDVLSKAEKLFDDLQAVDAVPTPQAQAAVADLQCDARSVAERWRVVPEEVAALNRHLEAAGIEKIRLP